MDTNIEELMASMTPATDTPPDVVAPIYIPYDHEEAAR